MCGTLVKVRGHLAVWGHGGIHGLKSTFTGLTLFEATISCNSGKTLQQLTHGSSAARSPRNSEGYHSYLAGIRLRELGGWENVLRPVGPGSSLLWFPMDPCQGKKNIGKPLPISGICLTFPLHEIFSVDLRFNTMLVVWNRGLTLKFQPLICASEWCYMFTQHEWAYGIHITLWSQSNLCWGCTHRNSPNCLLSEDCLIWGLLKQLEFIINLFSNVIKLWQWIQVIKLYQVNCFNQVHVVLK